MDKVFRFWQDLVSPWAVEGERFMSSLMFTVTSGTHEPILFHRLAKL